MHEASASPTYGVTLTMYKNFRSSIPALMITGLLPCLAACSGGAYASSATAYIADDFSDLVTVALDDTSLQDFDREVLQRAKSTGHIAQADYDEAFDRFAQCMERAGEPVMLTKLSNGLYKEKPLALSDGETLESALSVLDECSAGTTGVISSLYKIQQGNPELLADAYAVAHNCLKAKGLVDSEFTLEELRKTVGSPGLLGDTLEDRLPFNPYNDDAQACFVGANMAIAKATS